MDAYNEILIRATFHFQLTDKQTQRSAFAATAFRWITPILAAVVTAIISSKVTIFGVSSNGYAVWIGLLLTVFTIANSIIRPADIFKSSAKYANVFWTFITSFKLGFERLELLYLDEIERRKYQYDYLERKNEELSKLVSEFNGAFVPIQTTDDTAES